MRKFSLANLVGLALIFLAVTLWLAATSWSTAAAQGPPPSRPGSPPDVPGSPPGRTQPPQAGGGGAGVGGHGGGGYSYDPCMTVHGVVINWGYRNEPRVPVNLNGPGWQTQEIADDNGYYASPCLGIGIAHLDPVSPPWLRPMTNDDVVIRLGYRQTFEVNFGLYSGWITPQPQVIPTMTVNSDQAQPGDTVIYTIRVTNTLRSLIGPPPLMGEVMITDLLPETLTPVTATSTVGKLEWWTNLLTADIGTLSPGQTATIVVTAKVAANTPAAAIISNRASLLHHQHVAIQTPVLDVSVQPKLSTLPLTMN